MYRDDYEERKQQQQNRSIEGWARSCAALKREKDLQNYVWKWGKYEEDFEKYRKKIKYNNTIIAFSVL